VHSLASDKLSVGECIGKGVKDKNCGPNSSYRACICQYGLKKITNTLSKHIRSPGQYFDLKTPEYKRGVYSPGRDILHNCRLHRNVQYAYN